MKQTSFFKIGILCFALFLLSCDKDEIEIKVSDSEYISGGMGTSQTSGAIEYNFKIPSNYPSGKVTIDLVGNTSTQIEISETGDQQFQFLNLPSGIYDYTFEFSAIDNNTGSVNDPSINRLFSLNETLEVQNGKTLKIKVVLD